MDGKMDSQLNSSEETVMTQSAITDLQRDARKRKVRSKSICRVILVLVANDGDLHKRNGDASA
jgi:t-SNARE complex subunit (syntaxin)